MRQCCNIVKMHNESRRIVQDTFFFIVFMLIRTSLLRFAIYLLFSDSNDLRMPKRCTRTLLITYLAHVHRHRKKCLLLFILRSIPSRVKSQIYFKALNFASIYDKIYCSDTRVVPFLFTTYAILLFLSEILPF